MQYIVYRKEVCKILSEEDGIYRLEPVGDSSIKYRVPKDSELLKELITKEKVDSLLQEIPEIDIIENNEKQIELIYKDLMNRGTHEDLIKIIKTTFVRNQARAIKNKKLSEIDTLYFNRAEKYLYEEIGVALGLNMEEARDYIIEKLNKPNRK